LCTWFGGGAIGASVSGCELYPSSLRKNDTGSATLRGTRFPADFKFAMTRPVDMTVSAPPSLFNGRANAGLEVMNADGKLLFEGALPASQALKLRLPVPTKDHSLQLILRSNGVEKRDSVAINDDAIAHTFH
jgi:hypothetical protein